MHSTDTRDSMSAAKPKDGRTKVDKTSFIAESLGKVAESVTNRFWCTGDLDTEQPVQLVYRKKSGEWCEVNFPGATKEELQQLMRDACSVASFGIDDKQVTDRSYRDAYKLDPDLFASSLQLNNTPILEEIVATMVPDLHQVRAELYKLNVYAKGGHFKAHVDTPKPNQLFGSLVVCLPTQFTGGQLVTRSHSHEVVFDWSSPPLAPKRNVSWTAFFSDVEHEVQPVVGGYRVTLTYNLYDMQREGNKASCPRSLLSSNLAKELFAALSSPVFMRDGGVLGFGAHYVYNTKKLGTSSANHLSGQLKGCDRVVYLTAEALGLSVLVKPVVSTKKQKKRYLLSEFQSKYETRDGEDMCADASEPCGLSELFTTAPHRDKYVTWCQDLTKWQPAGARIYYNDYSSSGEKLICYYQAVAILIGIPQWGEFRRSLLSNTAVPAVAFDSSSCAEAISEEDPGREDRDCPALDDVSAAVLKRLCFHGEEASDSVDVSTESDMDEESGEEMDDWYDWDDYDDSYSAEVNVDQYMLSDEEEEEGACVHQ